MARGGYVIGHMAYEASCVKPSMGYTQPSLAKTAYMYAAPLSLEAVSLPTYRAPFAFPAAANPLAAVLNEKTSLLFTDRNCRAAAADNSSIGGNSASAPCPTAVWLPTTAIMYETRCCGTIM